MSERCPLCGAASTLEFVTPDRNRHVSDELFRYRRCSGCDVRFLENVPEDLSAYYAGDYHRAPDASELQEWASYETYKLELVRPYAPAGRIIDIGASYGAFSYLAKRAGYDVTAIEMDPDGCRFMERVLDLRVLQSDAPEQALRVQPQADAITMWHSIEHLRDPWLTVEAAAERLTTGGVLVVATPNPEGLQSHWLKARWTLVEAPRHLFLIPRESLTAHARQVGLSPLFSTSADVETRRCNRSGWQRGLQELGFRVPGSYWAGAALAAAMRPLERGVDNASAYVAIFEKR